MRQLPSASTSNIQHSTFNIDPLPTVNCIQHSTFNIQHKIVSPSFLKLVNSPLKFRVFMFTKLRAAFFSGLRIVHADENSCSVTIPYKKFTSNPFRSTYFACLSMAAEMSTGVLAMGNTYKRNPAISMLVVKVEGEFFKKADGLTTFICADGNKIRSVIEEAVSSGEARSIRAYAKGENSAGDPVAEFYITWSFKARPKRN